MNEERLGEILREETFRKLLNLIEGGNVPQAVLLSGPAGSGKRYLAKQFAMSVLCGKGDPPCHSCRSCELFVSGNHPSFFPVIPEKAEIKISQIRHLHAELARKVFFGKKRAILIQRADRMNRNASNSLLKILEEPPEGVHFILTASQSGRVQPTIRSRCQIFHIPPPSEEELTRIISEKGSAPPSPSELKAMKISEGNIDLFQELLSGHVPDSMEILSALLRKDYSRISDIAGSFKDDRVFRLGVIILKRLLLDLLLLSKDEKQCIINTELITERKVKGLISHPQKLVEFFYKLTALEFVPHQANRAFICESIMLSLSEMEAV